MREREVFRKLHFTQELKSKVVGFAINIFKNNAKQEEVTPVLFLSAGKIF